MQIHISLTQGRSAEAPWTHRLLLPLQGRALISHIFASYPAKTEFCFYGSENLSQVQSYIRLAHPEIKCLFGDERDFHLNPSSCLDFGRSELIEEYFRIFSEGLETQQSPQLSQEIRYEIGEQRIHFFADKTLARQLWQRNEEFFFSPKAEFVNEQFISYVVPQHTLCEHLTPELFQAFLETCKNEIWQPTVVRSIDFSAECKNTYFEKTLDAVQAYLQKYRGERTVPDWREILSRLPWDRISQGQPVRYHGRLRLDEMFLTDQGKIQCTLPATHFASEDTAGDIYFELAQIYHSLLHTIERYRIYETLLFDFMKSLSLDPERVYFLAKIIDLQAAPRLEPPLSDRLWYESLTELRDYIKQSPPPEVLL